MKINLEYYKIFYFVSKYGSISKAAEELSITQPAVSQAIKHLETDLECALFVRTSKGVRQTKEGNVLYEYVKRGYETLLAGEKKLSEMLDLEEGEICVGASDMTLKYYLLPYLEQFHEKFPQIRVIVTNAPTPETLQHLQDGKIDFGIVSTPVVEKQDFSYTPVRKIQDTFVAGKAFAGLKNKTLSYQELNQLPLMSLEGNTSTRTYVEEFLAKHGVVTNPEFELATSDMLVQFAMRNLGIASVVEDFAAEGLARGELFQLKFEEEIPPREICIVRNERIPVSAAAKRLLDTLETI